MCLYTKQICPLRARRDIVCYKEVVRLSEHLFETPYRRYTIQGKLPITLQINDTQGIEQAMSIYPRCLTVYGGMFHAWSDLKNVNHQLIIIKCIIPKGTLYYKGVRGDICARTLILQDVIRNY